MREEDTVCVGSDGLRYCKVCEEAKEAFFPEGVFMGMKKHSRQCACDRKAYEAEQKYFKDKEHRELVCRNTSICFDESRMGDMEEVTMPRGVQMLPVKSIQPFHDHPFHLYEGERLEDMIASVKEHGVLNPVIVQKLDTGYEMLSGHNRWNAAKLAGLKEIPAIVKTDLSEEEAYVYVIETNLMQRSFSDLDLPPRGSPSRSFWRLLRPQAIPLLPLLLKA